MKRKRGNVKQQKNPSMVGANANQTGLDNFDHAEFESRVKVASPQASTNVSCWQADLEKIVDKITDDNSKKAGKMGTKSSRGVDASSVNLIGSAALLQNERSHQEPQRLLDKYPRYNEQELNDSLLVIKTIMKMGEAEPFNIPVNPIALGVHDYFDVIDTPMDFGTICNNLEKGLKYKNSEDVFKDVQYIWENCCKYNKKGDYILELMERVKMNFMNHWITAGLYQDPGYREKKLNDALLVIKKIMKMDEAEPFNIPVNPIALGIHDYFDIVDTPMDFGTICNNLEKGLKYKDSEDVFKDVQYIWENCCKYNKKGDYILELMERVKMNFMNHWVVAGLFSKQSQTINGPLHLPPPRTRSTMRISKQGLESSMGPGGDNPGQQQLDQMGPIRVRSHQHLPILSQSHQCQTNSNQQLPSLQPTEANIGTADFTIKQRRSGGHRIYIATNELGEPIGLEAPKLTNFLDAMAQDGFMAPLTYADWRVMPDANKEKMWQQVELKFDIDPKCKSWIMKSLGKKWKDWKIKLKATHFNTHATNEERLADCDEKVIPDQWSILVQYWNLEEVEERNAKNKASRTQQNLYGTTGTKSSALVREEQAKKPDEKEPSQAELERFRLTYARKDGQPINGALPTIVECSDKNKANRAQQKLYNTTGTRSFARVREEQPQLREQTIQQQETLENRRRPQDILPQVKGQDRHVDPKPVQAEAIRVVSGANVEVREMKQRMVTMEQTCAQMASQMAAMMSMMSSIHKTPPNKHLPNVVADTSDALDGLPEQQVRPSTPRTVVSPFKASGIQTASKSKANP